MSHASSDGYERLYDFADETGNIQRDGVYRPLQPPPHTRVTILPPPPPSSNVSGGGAGSSSTHTSKSRSSKAKSQKKGRKMSWLLIHNTGETQTLNLDKRMLVQVRWQLPNTAMGILRLQLSLPGVLMIHTLIGYLAFLSFKFCCQQPNAATETADRCG